MNPRRRIPRSEMRAMPVPAIENFIQSILQSSDSTKMLKSLADLQKLLEQVFPRAVDYETAVCRIRNARRFLESREAGAARYEMRLLIQAVAQSPGQS